MATEPTTLLAVDSGVTPCAVCTILIGPGYYEQHVFRDRLTGWRVCRACQAFLNRQRERDSLRGVAV